MTKNLNLEAVGVKVDPNTNKVIGGHEGDNERSSAPNIYAIGDILHVGILTFCRNHSWLFLQDSISFKMYILLSDSSFKA